MKEPIKGLHLGKGVRHSMDGPTNMDPALTGVGIIGQGGYRTISGGSHTQSIVQGGKSIIHSNVITHVLNNSNEVTLESDSFTFDPLKAETLMVAPLIEPFIASDGDVRSSDSDKDPAARKEPIKDTQTIKEPIKGPHLGKRVRHSMDGPTDMDPVVIGIGIIGKGGPQTISGGSHTQSIVQGGGKHNLQ